MEDEQAAVPPHEDHRYDRHPVVERKPHEPAAISEGELVSVPPRAEGLAISPGEDQHLAASSEGTGGGFVPRLDSPDPVKRASHQRQSDDVVMSQAVPGLGVVAALEVAPSPHPDGLHEHGAGVVVANQKRRPSGDPLDPLYLEREPGSSDPVQSGSHSPHELKIQPLGIRGVEWSQESTNTGELHRNRNIPPMDWVSRYEYEGSPKEGR